MSSLDLLNRFKFNRAGTDISRSVLALPFEHKTTINVGDLTPLGLFEVLPGDSFKVDLSAVVRSLTPVAPVMDNAFLDVYAFFVPNRISCLHPKDWEQICGENVNGYWAPTSEATLVNTGNTFNIGDVNELLPDSAASHYGLPVSFAGFNSLEVSSLPLIGYVKIWNEWFRDQNVQSPINLTKPTDINFPTTGVFYDGSLFESCLRVNKLHDYFTSCLPSPQKGEAVFLPLGSLAPVIGTATLKTLEGNNAVGGTVAIPSAIPGVITSSGAPNDRLTISGLTADLSNATASTINALRQAFAIQRLLEKDARGGSRYRELIQTHFNTTIPDSTVQIPQYLGGHRINLNMNQVLQTSSTDSSGPLGDTGAFSNTPFNQFLFDKSFTEHGYIHILACIRNSQSYSQGIAKHWTRNRRFDWYYPGFANLGEQPVYKRELKFNEVGDNADAVFGYNEAWAEYRFIPNMVTGYMAAEAGDTNLLAWTYQNRFSSQPSLTGAFMAQQNAQVSQTLASYSPYQYFGDFFFNIKATRPMPVYSIPGLIDHH